MHVVDRYTSQHRAQGEERLQVEAQDSHEYALPTVAYPKHKAFLSHPSFVKVPGGKQKSPRLLPACLGRMLGTQIKAFVDIGKTYSSLPPFLPLQTSTSDRTPTPAGSSFRLHHRLQGTFF